MTVWNKTTSPSPCNWSKPTSASQVTETVNLLQENGSLLLQENGSNILVEMLSGFKKAVNSIKTIWQ